jgi:hypothetical protein
MPIGIRIDERGAPSMSGPKVGVAVGIVAMPSLILEQPSVPLVSFPAP